jgi:hypothetical protein
MAVKSSTWDRLTHPCYMSDLRQETKTAQGCVWSPRKKKVDRFKIWVRMACPLTQITWVLSPYLTYFYFWCP